MSRLLWATVLLAATLGPSLGAQTATADERDVLATVQRLFDAMRARDTAAMRSLFAPGARLVGVRTRQSGEVVMQELTAGQFADFVARDRKSTRLNSSHANISYAVFCLKKKK